MFSLLYEFRAEQSVKHYIVLDQNENTYDPFEIFGSPFCSILSLFLYPHGFLSLPRFQIILTTNGQIGYLTISSECIITPTDKAKCYIAVLSRHMYCYVFLL